MLMADMTDDQRAAVTALWQSWFPEGAELLELVDVLWSGWECDHNAALIREADGAVRIKILSGVAPGRRGAARHARGADGRLPGGDRGDAPLPRHREGIPRGAASGGLGLRVVWEALRRQTGRLPCMRGGR